MNFRNRLRTAAGLAAAVLVLTLAVPTSAAPAGSPRNAEFYELQWNLKAAHAHSVITSDAEGRGSTDVLVAVVDTGIDYLHPNLQGLVDLAHSKSFVARRVPDRCELSPGVPEPGTPYRPQADGFDESELAVRTDGRLPFQDYHSHGTAVAGLISSTGALLAGVTSRTKLLAVKVHGISRMNCLSVYLAGVDYAVEQGADVIHLSFPLEILRTNQAAVDRVNDTMNRAHNAGAVLVAAAGNTSAMNPVPQVVGDPARSNMFRFCEGRWVICVSATGPPSAEKVNASTWDASAAYTYYGPAIDVAGPGGSGIFPNQIVPVWLTCSQVGRATTGAATACFKVAGQDAPVIWPSTGTSFAAATTSGLAALMVRLTGSNDPLEIEALIEDSADDLGEPGFDEYYGVGRINVQHAVNATRP